MVWIKRIEPKTWFINREIYDLKRAEEIEWIKDEIWLNEELRNHRITKEACWTVKI